MGEHEVYICYDDEDQLAADVVCNALEDNDISCWLRNRDGSIDLKSGEIIQAIKSSEVVILIFSEFSKHSNSVVTEVNVAFESKKTILTFNVDESDVDGGLSYFINEKLVIEIFPGTDSKVNTLIKYTFKALKRNESESIFSKKTKDLQDKLVKQSKKRISERYKETIFSKLKIPIVVAVFILVICAGIYAVMNFDDGIGGTSEAEKSLPNITMKIIDFHVDDVRKTDTGWNYSYFVAGTLSPQPGADEEYRIVVDFYDESGYLVNSSQTQFGNVQIVNKGFLFGSTGSSINNIKRVDAQLINDNDIVVAHATSIL